MDPVHSPEFYLLRIPDDGQNSDENVCYIRFAVLATHDDRFMH
jgi:hypothetical protein